MTTKKQEISNFIKTWSSGAHEVADKVTFWNTFLRILGVDQSKIDDKSFINYEKPIKLKKNEHFHGSIDAYIPSTHVLIEQKSSGVDLTKEEKRDNGGHTEKITPFQQARRYDNHLSANERAYFYVLCNFNEFRIYDVRSDLDSKPIIITLKELDENLYQFDFMINKKEPSRLIKEQQISVAAGNIVNEIYKELLNIFAKYKKTGELGELTDEKITHSINSLCVRLVFCLYAEDANLFATKNAFYDYLVKFEPAKIRIALKDLFNTLNTKKEDRIKNDPFWNSDHSDLKDFPYVNGGLFADQSIVIPPFTQKLKDIVLEKASRKFDWSGISPTVFGAVFESTLNPDDRRQGGMHYTSVKNIHKVIDPLFLDDLKKEFEQIKESSDVQKKEKFIDKFHVKLSHLTFFDPACGSGNFLTETYLSLRRLENEIIKYQHVEPTLDVGQAKDYIKVSIKQFYGIEINDFAVSVAKTAMWIAECQMFEETKDIIYAEGDFLPLKTYVNIHEGNALRIDWNNVVDKNKLNYIIGNPPFIGLSSLPAKDKELRKQQTHDMDLIFGDLPKHGKLDYVTAWYEKATNMMQNTNIQSAFVSTNSIVQGEQVAILWKHLMNEKHVIINFAYRSFNWLNDTQNMAHVVCVIIGFSVNVNRDDKFIVNEDGSTIYANHINGYLTNYHDTYIKSRKKDVPFDLPEMHKGSQPTDGGGLTVKEKDAQKLLQKYPQLKNYIKPYIGSYELINNKKRYCLWLTKADPKKYRKIPEVRERLNQVIKTREKSTTKSVRTEDIKTPYLFSQIRQPKTDYIAVPEVSSSERKYIPIAFLSKDIIASNKLYLLSTNKKWLFAVLISSVHMDWMRVVAGRLGTGYSYSPSVYSNFPWIDFSKEQKEKFEQTAQAILDARKNYSDSSLADLYDPLTMPADLLKAHKENDKAVLVAYGLSSNASESEIVAHLFKMYEELTKKD